MPHLSLWLAGWSFPLGHISDALCTFLICGLRKERKKEQELCNLKQTKQSFFFSLSLSCFGISWWRPSLRVGEIRPTPASLHSCIISDEPLDSVSIRKSFLLYSCSGLAHGKKLLLHLLFLLFGISWKWQEDKKWPAAWPSHDSLLQLLLLSIWVASSPCLCVYLLVFPHLPLHLLEKNSSAL